MRIEWHARGAVWVYCKGSSYAFPDTGGLEGVFLAGSVIVLLKCRYNVLLSTQLLTLLQTSVSVKLLLSYLSPWRIATDTISRTETTATGTVQLSNLCLLGTSTHFILVELNDCAVVILQVFATAGGRRSGSAG